jgi:hypothetical protein
VDASIEPTIIGCVSRQASLIAFRKVERHAHDNTRNRSPGHTPFWGWSPALASDSGLAPLRLMTLAWDGDPPAARLFRLLTSADSRESENAAAPKHRSRRRDA